jgi:hypothetical protein
MYVENPNLVLLLKTKHAIYTSMVAVNLMSAAGQIYMHRGRCLARRLAAVWNVSIKDWHCFRSPNIQFTPAS